MFCVLTLSFAFLSTCTFFARFQHTGFASLFLFTVQTTMYSDLLESVHLFVRVFLLLSSLLSVLFAFEWGAHFPLPHVLSNNTEGDIYICNLKSALALNTSTIDFTHQSQPNKHHSVVLGHLVYVFCVCIESPFTVYVCFNTHKVKPPIPAIDIVKGVCVGMCTLK